MKETTAATVVILSLFVFLGYLTAYAGPSCHKMARDALLACQATCQDPVRYPTPANTQACLRSCADAYKDAQAACKDAP